MGALLALWYALVLVYVMWAALGFVYLTAMRALERDGLALWCLSVLFAALTLTFLWLNIAKASELVQEWLRR